MKNLSKLFLSLLLLVITSSCSNHKSFKPVNIQEEVSNTFNNYVEHVNSKGLKGVESYFADDSTFYWVEDGLIQYPSWDSLASSIEQFYPSVSSVSMNISDTKIHVIDHNHAMLFTSFKEDLRMESGFAFTLDGALTILLRKEEDGWKFLSGHSSIKKPRASN